MESLMFYSTLVDFLLAVGGTCLVAFVSYKRNLIDKKAAIQVSLLAPLCIVASYIAGRLISRVIGSNGKLFFLMIPTLCFYFYLKFVNTNFDRQHQEWGRKYGALTGFTALAFLIS